MSWDRRQVREAMDALDVLRNMLKQISNEATATRTKDQNYVPKAVRERSKLPLAIDSVRLGH